MRLLRKLCEVRQAPESCWWVVASTISGALQDVRGNWQHNSFCFRQTRWCIHSWACIIARTHTYICKIGVMLHGRMHYCRNWHTPARLPVPGRETALATSLDKWSKSPGVHGIGCLSTRLPLVWDDGRIISSESTLQKGGEIIMSSYLFTRPKMET